MTPHWESLLLGLVVGLLVSSVFFLGLKWGMHVALRSSKPVGVILVSAVCRVSLLIWIGYGVTAHVGNVWPAAGYAAGFLLIRTLAIQSVRSASMQNSR